MWGPSVASLGHHSLIDLIPFSVGSGMNNNKTNKNGLGQRLKSCSHPVLNPFAKQPQFDYSVIKWIHDDDDDVDSRTSCPRMSVDPLGTNCECDQCWSTVQCCFTSTETVRLIRTESPGRPHRLSHSSWTLMDTCLNSTLIIYQCSEKHCCVVCGVFCVCVCVCVLNLIAWIPIHRACNAFFCLGSTLTLMGPSP